MLYYVGGCNADMLAHEGLYGLVTSTRRPVTMGMTGRIRDEKRCNSRLRGNGER